MVVAMDSTHARTHHDLPVHEVLLLTQTDPDRGLSEAEASARLARYGPNRLPATAGIHPVVRFIRQMHNPLIYVLLAAGVVTFFLQEYVDSAVILGVVLINTIIGYVQESKAESALDALRSMVHTGARVVRDGETRDVESDQLVPGDLVRVEAGDKMPADLRLLGTAELQVDESALTGESLPVAKDEVVVLPASTAVADRRNMVYSGTFATAGTGSGIVVATGAQTELGEIHRLVGVAETLATPLTKKLARFSTFLTVVILALAVVTFAVGTLRGEPPADMFVAAVALAVGAIPEGLPAAVTVTLAIGVGRMARRRAIIRRLPAVETLGSATVICSDKTGTLTENHMQVRTLWTPSGSISLEQPEAAGLAAADLAAHRTLVIATLCNDSRVGTDGTEVGDPTELAMILAARRLGIDPPELPRLRTLPFSSARQYMATMHSAGDGANLVFVKGAVERVLERCDRQLDSAGQEVPIDAAAVVRAADLLAAQGMRVLATAYAGDVESGDLTAGGVHVRLVFTGLQAMQDPPRETAAAAVATCHAAGLSVKMITGDHAVTAAAIARQVGIVAEDQEARVLTGADLQQMSDTELVEVVEGADVFARVTPEQKLRLVVALQAHDHVVAMTGDGVNDAPALKQADIGVAMGRGGTEVAKEAGDMVLTDDDFATIEAAVEEGRGVFDNLTKFIVWTLPTNAGEGLLILVAILMGWQLPILPTQILWINMTTAVALGLMLAWEPKEPGIMTRPPRDPGRPLLSGPIVFRTLLVAGLLVVGAQLVFDWQLGGGASLPEARTAAVNVFVMTMAFYLFSCRSLSAPVWRVGFFSNPYLLVGVAVQAVLQLALTYLPVMNRLLQTAPIGLNAWLLILAVAVVTTLVVSLDKWRLHGREI